MRSFAQFRFPFIQQRPIDGAGAEVGHVLIAVQTINRRLQQLAIVAKRGAVAWQQPLDTAGLNSFERINERWQIRSVMGMAEITKSNSATDGPSAAYGRNQTQ